MIFWKIVTLARFPSTFEHTSLSSVSALLPHGWVNALAPKILVTSLALRLPRSGRPLQSEGVWF